MFEKHASMYCVSLNVPNSSSRHIKPCEDKAFSIRRSRGSQLQFGQSMWLGRWHSACFHISPYRTLHPRPCHAVNGVSRYAAKLLTLGGHHIKCWALFSLTGLLLVESWLSHPTPCFTHLPKKVYLRGLRTQPASPLDE